MRHVTLRGLFAHKTRLALTALAIVLGVTFISGTFVLTDTLNSTFSNLFTSVYSKIDFQVRGAAQFGSGESATRNSLPESLVTRVQSVRGVGGAYGNVEGYAQFIAPDGKPISSNVGTVGVGWDTDKQISNLHLIAGNPPTTSDDVVMDAATAKSYNFSVGQQVRILGGGLKSAQTFTITGIAQFGTADNLVGETLAAFTLPTAQRVVGETGLVDFIDVVTKPGADKAAVQRSIAQALPSDAEVVTGQTIIDEYQTVVSQALSSLNTILLVFALISLFVGAFTIYNTFSITVGQRTRELALLRIVGASRPQVFRSVLTESVIVGFVSSAIGVGLGVVAAIGLEALLSGFGTSLPTGPLTFEARTAIVGLAVGTLVTVVSAVGPARNAVRIPPVAALTDRPADSAGGNPTRRRLISGTALAVLGAALLGIGLSKPVVALVGVGAACIFLGVAMLAPTIARPLSGLLGRPLAVLLGTPGQLGRENSMRSPRRTAQTASALMIGLALVSAMAVFGASFSESATSSVDQAISADLLISVNGSGQLSDSVPAAAAAVPGVTATSTVYRNQFEFESTLTTLTGVTTQNLASTVILRMTAGSTAALAQGELLIDSTTAAHDHLSVGDTVPIRFAYTGPATIKIGGIYQANALIQSYLVSAPYFLAHFRARQPGAVLVRTNGGPAVETGVSNAVAPYGDVQVQTRAQFQQAQVSSINSALGLVYVLLALAVLIALIGIVNTLMLSVLERTREIGLLRAIGMRRPQVRAMVRSESVILAAFGALIGIVIGTLMGLALVSSLRQQGMTETSVPWVRLVEFLILAAILGLGAASWPARRAARLDVLAAIATR
ncbi:MAG: ABC transporter permease [Streptosporangiaceae bacterium]